MFDRDDGAELVRCDAGGRCVDDADHAGRQRGLVSRLFGGFVGHHGRGRAKLGPPAAEDAARGGGVRFVLLFLAADVRGKKEKEARQCDENTVAGYGAFVACAECLFLDAARRRLALGSLERVAEGHALVQAPAEVLVEGRGFAEHLLHRSDAGGVPRADVLVEGRRCRAAPRRTAKQIRHVSHPPSLPSRDVAVRRLGGGVGGGFDPSTDCRPDSGIIDDRATTAAS